MNLLRRIAAFFETRPTYEQIHEAVRLPAYRPPKKEEYEPVETDGFWWKFAHAMHSPYSDSPPPFIGAVEYNEFEFDPMSFDSVKKKGRIAYYVWRKKS